MNKDEFIANYVNPLVEEPRRQLVISFLDSTPGVKLFEAPASTRHDFHHCYDGGLIDHVCQVMTMTAKLRDGLADYEDEEIPSLESIFMVSLLHDVHKSCDYIGRDYYIDNILTRGSRSEKKPYKINEDCFLHVENNSISDWDSFFMEHAVLEPSGLKSLQVTLSFAPALFQSLTESERNAIIYHAGAYETSRYKLNGKEDMLQILFHCADMLSSRYEAMGNTFTFSPPREEAATEQAFSADFTTGRMQTRPAFTTPETETPTGNVES